MCSLPVVYSDAWASALGLLGVQAVLVESKAVIIQDERVFCPWGPGLIGDKDTQVKKAEYLKKNLSPVIE